MIRSLHHGRPTQVPEEDPPGNMTANQSQMMQDLYSRYYADVITTDAGESWGNYQSEMAAFQLGDLGNLARELLNRIRSVHR